MLLSILLRIFGVELLLHFPFPHLSHRPMVVSASVDMVPVLPLPLPLPPLLFPARPCFSSPLYDIHPFSLPLLSLIRPCLSSLNDIRSL